MLRPKCSWSWFGHFGKSSFVWVSRSNLASLSILEKWSMCNVFHVIVFASVAAFPYKCYCQFAKHWISWTKMLKLTSWHELKMCKLGFCIAADQFTFHLVLVRDKKTSQELLMLSHVALYWKVTSRWLTKNVEMLNPVAAHACDSQCQTEGALCVIVDQWLRVEQRRNRKLTQKPKFRFLHQTFGFGRFRFL